MRCFSAPGMTKKERLAEWKQCVADLKKRLAKEEERKRKEAAQRGPGGSSVNSYVESR